MRIIVVGCGKIGRTVAEKLVQEGHDVVMIDRQEELLQKAQDEMDLMIVQGNGASGSTLIEADAAHSDIIIAATANDEINMICCMAAKRLGCKYAIARIRDPEYNQSLTFLKNALDIDTAINPERTTAYEISRLLRFPAAGTIEHFAKDLVEMVQFRVKESDPFVQMPLKDIPHRFRDIPQVLYAVVEHDGKVCIPNGDSVLHVGDKVQVCGETSTISDYFRYIGRTNRKVKNIMVLGGGRISYYLAKTLSSDNTHLTIIEINQEKARQLSSQFPNIHVIAGDGTDQNLLQEEGLQQMDAFVALCDRDEENVMTGMFAAREGVSKVIVKNNRISYTDIFTQMGLDCIVSPKAITCATIMRYVRARGNANRTTIEKLYRMMDGKVEAIEFIASANASYLNKPLKELRLKKNTLIGIIVRNGRVKIPFGNDHIEAGDSVVVIACEADLSSLDDVVQ